ncbi:MAG: TOBE domain-containing protein [Pseudomonadota bacterium]
MKRAPNLPATPRSDTLHQALGHAISDKRLEVLRRIGVSGSISQAAREAGISYKAAWQAIDTLTSLSGTPLVERTVGGSGGGGARITEEGRRLLVLADELAQARDAVLARHAGAGASVSTGAGLGVQTSMRNQLPAWVSLVQSQAQEDPLVLVRLCLEDGQELTSSITRESADLLGLRADLPVLLLCKATAVEVVERVPDLGVGQCQLSGKVLRIARGANRDEVTLALDGGGTWVGFAARPFGRRRGQRAFALMASSALVIALDPHQS